MNRKEYLDTLEKLLADCPAEERKSVLYDYEEHFRAGTEKGRAEEEIARTLGEPREIVRLIRAGYAVRRAESGYSLGKIFRAVVATVALSFLNVIVILGPFLTVAGILCGLTFGALAVTLWGLWFFFASLFVLGLGLAALVKLCFAVAVLGLGLLAFLFMAYLIKFCYRLTIKYLHWNISLIRE